MAMVIMVLTGIVGLVSLVCWIMVLIKMFGESVGKGIIGLICGLYALVWGWQNQPEKVSKNLMMAWTGAIVVSILLNIIANAIGASAAGS
ncbi:MAG: hypothetical protein JNM27_06645 [Leptospirales bacterium]|nr:hypothetical protein [Leptospirales bacterium]